MDEQCLLVQSRSTSWQQERLAIWGSRACTTLLRGVHSVRGHGGVLPPTFGPRRRRLLLATVSVAVPDVIRDAFRRLNRFAVWLASPLCARIETEVRQQQKNPPAARVLEEVGYGEQTVTGRRSSPLPPARSGRCPQLPPQKSSVTEERIE